MKILITGNPTFGLASELFKLYPDATFVSRESGYDLTTRDGYRKLGEIIKDYDIFINSSALWKFNQTLILESVYKKCLEIKHDMRIICIGSTTDRVKKATHWIYNAEKLSLIHI